MLHLGLLITKDDDEIIDRWFRMNCQFFDGIVCLDGSRTDTARAVAVRQPNVKYAHESETTISRRTDHGLRAVGHNMLVAGYGNNGWITLCHSDEFFYHSPRVVCERAEAEGYNGIAWYALHFVPHPMDLAQWPVLRHLPIDRRFRFYHWDFAGSGLPWIEFRSYRNVPDIRWDALRHGNTQPRGCERVAAFHPAYRHFKIASLDPTLYEPGEGRSIFSNHWTGVEDGRTGVPWTVNRFEDFFVSKYESYERCDYFRGVFEHNWNLGEEYRGPSAHAQMPTRAPTVG